MDGPNVNWKFISLLENYVDQTHDSKFLNIGSCGLHIVHGAFKDAITVSKWTIEQFFTDIFYLFSDSPARRSDYVAVTNHSKFPFKFCRCRWVENLSVAKRALEMIPTIRVFCDAIKEKKVNQPTCKSYFNVLEGLKDPLLEIKIHCFISIAEIVNSKFLVKYQTDAPMIPFLAEDLFQMNKLLMFRVLKTESVNNLTTHKNVAIFNFKNKDDHCHVHRVDLGFMAEKGIKALLSKKEISPKQALEIRGSCQAPILRLLEKLQEKSPFSCQLVRCLACLNPTEISKNPQGAIRKFDSVLQVLADRNKVDSNTYDTIKVLIG